MKDELPELRALVCFRTDDNGEEHLWAEAVRETAYQVLSVPVFSYGVSRGTVVMAEPGKAGALAFARVEKDSAGATVRVYLDGQRSVRDFYLTRLLPLLERQELDVGPATFLEPKVLAMHVTDRTQWQSVASVLDGLAASGDISFWELGDPDLSPQAGGDADSRRARWKLVHPPPGDPLSEARQEGLGEA